MKLPPFAVFPSRRALLAAACALALIPAARAGTPRVNSCYPSGGQRGTEVEVAFAGSNLADARDVLFDDGGFQVTYVGFENNRFKAKIKIAPDARLGEHLYRVISNSGIADLRLFYVSPYPMIEAVKEKDNPDKAQEVPLNVTVYGRTQQESQDHYVVQLKKDQRLTATVIGARLQTQQIYDPFIRIEKEGGMILTEVDDTAFSRQDPVASIIAPEDGRYVVTIKESTNSGIGECHYLLHLGTYVQPLSVYPLGGKAGEELKVQLLGDSVGPIESKIQLPAKPTDDFELYAAHDNQPAPMPNTLRVSNFPNVLEVEPNDDPAHATTCPPELPLALNGIIEKKGDIDYFKITAKKGVAYDLNIYARQLRSPLDSVLAIYDAKGNRLALNDDDGQPDSHLRWTAPGDGEFLVSVTDQLGRGGDLYTYRVEIKPVAQELAVYLPEMVINSSQERRAVPAPRGNRYASLIRVKRLDVGGDVQIVPQDLPPGVKYTLGIMDKSVDTVPIVFETDPDASITAKTFRLDVKLAEPPKDAPAPPGDVVHVVSVVENGNQKPYYTVTEHQLPIAVTEEPPVKITLVQPKVPLLQNGPMPLKVKLERKGDFKGPVTLGLLYAPPGVGSAGTSVVKEGENEGQVIISANDKAQLHKWNICVTGTVDYGTGPVWISTQMGELEVAAPFLAGKIQRTFVDQGDSSTVTVKLEQLIEFAGKAKITLQGLPQGVTAEEREITKDDKEVKIPIKADATATSGQHRQLFCQFRLEKDGEAMTSNFAQGGVLRVDKATIAKNEVKK
jgi:hypothetical protein